MPYGNLKEGGGDGRAVASDEWRVASTTGKQKTDARSRSGAGMPYGKLRDGSGDEHNETRRGRAKVSPSSTHIITDFQVLARVTCKFFGCLGLAASRVRRGCRFSGKVNFRTLKTTGMRHPSVRRLHPPKLRLAREIPDGLPEWGTPSTNRIYLAKRSSRRELHSRG